MVHEDGTDRGGKDTEQEERVDDEAVDDLVEGGICNDRMLLIGFFLFYSMFFFACMQSSFLTKEIEGCV